MNHSSQYDEKELLALVAAGNEPAFRQLFDAYHQRIYSFAFFLTRSDVLAEDITQEIFIKIWNHRSELSGLVYFTAWLKTLVRNQSYTYLRRLTKERLILHEVGQYASSSTPGTETDVQDKEYSRLLQEAIQQLPAQQKKVYLLSRQEGLKQEEIAEKLGISVNTVKNHMKAALLSIRKYLDGRIDTLILLAIALFFHD